MPKRHRSPSTTDTTRAPKKRSPTSITESCIEKANGLSLDTFITRYFSPSCTHHDSRISDPLSTGTVQRTYINGTYTNATNTHRDHHTGPSNTGAAFTHPTTNDKYTISLTDSTSISPADLNACFELIKETSADMYRSSERGWSARRKKREMKERDMRFLLVRRQESSGSAREDGIQSSDKSPRSKPTTTTSTTTSTSTATPTRTKTGTKTPTPTPKPINKPVEAFLSFMLTYEDDRQVIYCYEIHLSDHLRGCGLGGHLMRIMEKIGSRVGAEAAMLTCFTKNVGGLRFYQGQGYVEDAYSPAPQRSLRSGVVEKATYVIMSKALQPRTMRDEDGNGNEHF